MLILDDGYQYERMTISLIIENMEGGSVTPKEGLFLMMYLDNPTWHVPDGPPIRHGHP